MERLRVLTSSDLLHGEHVALELPEPLMWGENRDFHHQDPEVQAFRRAVPIYCGDFSLNVVCLRRQDALEVDFKRFAANELRRRFFHYIRGSEPALSAEGRFGFRDAFHVRQLSYMPPAEQVAPFVDALPHRAPVDVLWQFANFGCLLWDWKQKTLELLGDEGRPRWREDVYAKAVNGPKFLPRIFVDVPPELTERDTADVLERALAGLGALPDLRNGLPRSELEKLIVRDVDALDVLCRKHGRFGDAVLPGAFEPITGILLKGNTGNEGQAFLETGSHYHFISVFSS